MGSQITDRKVITRGRLVPCESNVHTSRLHHTKGGARQVESSPFHCTWEGRVYVLVCVECSVVSLFIRWEERPEVCFRMSLSLFTM